jgi:predicted nucleic acid-binding protein
VTRLLVDTSVVIKWFHSEGEPELSEARRVRDAHVAGEVEAHILDLGIYEVGNVLARALRWNAVDVADQLEDLLAIVGPPVAFAPSWMRDAATLAQRHSLTFYDASWAAAAAGAGMGLVSADRQLLRAGLAESLSAVAARLRLPPGVA